jgi:hypothetical protein
VNRAEAHQSEGGLIPLYHFNLVIARAQFRFDTPQLAAGSFICISKIIFYVKCLRLTYSLPNIVCAGNPELLAD